MNATAPPTNLLKRLAMVAATAFLAINLWTGAPLFALWVGSRVVGDTTLSMKAVFVVVIVLAVLVFSMALALAWLNTAYDRLIGRPSREARMTWMRSMRAEGDAQERLDIGMTALEQIVMASVYLAVISLLVWFFFLAHYSVTG
ncbi:MAG TPA: hypothetical protein VGG08_01775 [Solirubrobacteraceae bacterium]|jgi:hypothetical protein